MFGQNMMVGAGGPTDFTWTIKVSVKQNDDGAIASAVPFSLYGLPDTVSVAVDWGDGKSSVLTPSAYSSDQDGLPSIHYYDSEGEYTISMTANKYSWSQINIV